VVWTYHGILVHVKVDKMSISFEADLGESVREAARRAGTGLSSWLADAAAAKLRAEALAGFLDEWEREHGPLTADELAAAEHELGLRADDAA
jgi:hypothetical protein